MKKFKALPYLLILFLLIVVDVKAKAYILDDMQISWPVPQSKEISSGYGERAMGWHAGIDIAAPIGTDIVAVKDGLITFKSQTCTHNYGKTKSCGCGGGYGNYFILTYKYDDDYTVEFLYAHCTDIYVTIGQTVKEGDIIASVGSTGFSTGSHLHFEVKTNGQEENPMFYLNPDDEVVLGENYGNKKYSLDGREWETFDDVLINTGSILDLTHHVWGMVGSCLNNNDDFNNGIKNIENMSNSYSYIFKLFAYSLVILLFGINVIENTIKYELFTIKGGVSVLGKLYLSKVWIDLSVPICFEIIKIADGMTSAIVRMGIHNLTFNPPLTVLDVSFKGNFGEVIAAFLLELIMIIPLILMSLFVSILAVCILVKLGIRTIELCLMVIISPLFFACLVADATRPIFKRFIMNFITTAFQTVFMSIIYIIGIEWMQQYASADETDLLLWILGSLSWLIVLISMTIMMLKPPKVLTNIINS